MRNILCSLIIISVLVLNVPPANSRAEYDSLPALDGKVDGAPDNFKDQLENKSEQAVEEDKTPEDTSINLPKHSNTKISAANDNNKRDSVAAFDRPKLDMLKPEMNKSYLTDNIRFAKYEKDLNEMILSLLDLQKAIEEGVSIQIFSAKAMSVKFKFDLLKEKYKYKKESQLESFKIVESIVKNAVYTKDYWFKSNKIDYNQGTTPDQIIQTKFLVIKTNVDKLVELVKMETVLTQE